VLIIDDTNYPKYGLKKYARKLKNLKTSGYEDGFKTVFLLSGADEDLYYL